MTEPVKMRVSVSGARGRVMRADTVWNVRAELAEQLVEYGQAVRPIGHDHNGPIWPS